MKPQSATIIKKISACDYEALATLRHKSWPQDSISAHHKDIMALFAKDRPLYARRDGFIAYDDRHAVGFIELSLRPYVNGCLKSPVGFIEGLYCAPDYDKEALSLSFISKATTWAKDNGARELATDTYLENTIAQQDHQRWGFQATEKIVYFRKKL